jgi:hypothetical protein
MLILLVNGKICFSPSNIIKRTVNIWLIICKFMVIGNFVVTFFFVTFVWYFNSGV